MKIKITITHSITITITITITTITITITRWSRRRAERTCSTNSCFYLTLQSTGNSRRIAGDDAL